MIYRLTLGQPNPEDFLEVLSRGSDAICALLHTLLLDLSALGVRHGARSEQRADSENHSVGYEQVLMPAK